MLLEKQIKKNFIEQNITQNIFLLPFLMVLLQFCFLFVALINSHYFFEKKVLFVGGCLVFFWGSFFIRDFLKEKWVIKNWKNILLLIFFICFCLAVIRILWISTNYLRIDAIKRFFEGKIHIDTLYHSVHAESIITYGYPSLLFNSATFHAYHCFSHYLLAGLSLIIGVPCFITYNYIYPIVFFPLLFYLLQKTIIIGRSFYSQPQIIGFIDYLLLLCLAYGFFRVSIQRKIGCNIMLSMCNMETLLISIVLLLSYIFIIDIGYRSVKKFENFNCFILIPIFIFILTYTKFSTGFVFFLGASYYFLRKYFLKNIKCLIFCIYIFLFFIFNYVLLRLSISYPVTDKSSSDNIFHLFYYVRKYCYHGQIKWILYHYLFLFIPVFFIVGFSKKDIFTTKFLHNTKSIFQEMSFLLLFGTCLIGVFFNNDSSFSFVIPVYFFSWLLFLSYNLPMKLSKYCFQFCKQNEILFKAPAFFCIVIIACSLFLIYDVHFVRSVIVTLRSRISLVDFRADIPGKIKELFLPVTVIENEDYKMLNQIRYVISNKSKKDYCVFLSSDSGIIDNNDLGWYKPPNNIYYARPYWSVGAYLGIPVINGMYEDNGLFYRGDGKLFGAYNDFPGYGLPPALCDKKITKENMIERAKFLHKRHLIVINRHSYDIIDVE